MDGWKRETCFCIEMAQNRANTTETTMAKRLSGDILWNAEDYGLSTTVYFRPIISNYLPRHYYPKCDPSVSYIYSSVHHSSSTEWSLSTEERRRWRCFQVLRLDRSIPFKNPTRLRSREWEDQTQSLVLDSRFKKIDTLLCPHFADI